MLLHSSWVWDVPEGDALAITLGFVVPEVLLPSSWVWDVPEDDALAITLGFFVPEVLLPSSWVWDVPEGDALAIALGLESAKCYCVPFTVEGRSRSNCIAKTCTASKRELCKNDV